jgi:hypothetical protein
MWLDPGFSKLYKDISRLLLLREMPDWDASWKMREE